MLPKTINFHLTHRCNARCIFCFAPRTRELQFADRIKIIHQIGALPTGCTGRRRVNFVGGEPTILNDLPELLNIAKRVGLGTSIVTNGLMFRRDGYLESIVENLDMIGLSLDSSDPEICWKIGRHPVPIPTESWIDVGRLIRRMGIPLKVNTIVCQYNAHQDLSSLILSMKPFRWKIFQAIKLAGVNDDRKEDWTIDNLTFQKFLKRHHHLKDRGIIVVPESEDELVGSYAMISPNGKFYDSVTRRYRFSSSILDVGIEPAFDEIQFSHEKYNARGGRYQMTRATKHL